MTTPGPDTVRAGGGSNTIDGLAGDDLIEPGQGPDTVAGGPGTDTLVLDKRGEFREFDGFLKTRLLTADGKEAVKLADVARVKTITGGFGGPYTKTDSITGFERLKFRGDTANDPSHNDHVAGGRLRDVLHTGTGRDTIYGGLGDDIDGGSGRDTLHADLSGTSQAVVWTDGGIEPLDDGTRIQSIETAELTTGSGDDELRFRRHDDTLRAGGGDDVIEPGQGADTVAGGAGTDTLVLDKRGEFSELDGFLKTRLLTADGKRAATLADVARVDTVLGGGVTTTDTVSGIERIVFHGDTANDPSHNDHIAGGDGPDVIHTGTGSDTIYAGLGDDIDGGSGRDTLHADLSGTSEAIVWTNGSIDPLDDGTRIRDIETVDLTTGAGDDELRFGRHNETLRAGAGDDRIEPGKGADTVAGGPGTDTLVLDKRGEFGAFEGFLKTRMLTAEGERAETLADVARVETVRGGGVTTTDTVSGFERVVFHGDTANDPSHNDHVAGGSGADELHGGTGADSLIGAGNDDTLEGQDGADTLRGGAGTDTAVYGEARDSYTVSGDTASAQVSGPDGGDSLSGIERLKFGDGTTVTLDAPNAPPSIDAEQSFTVAASAAQGTTVGTIAAGDPDGSVSGFAITDGNTDRNGDGTRPFAVSAGGELRVTDPADLTAEDGTTVYRLTVEARDGQGATASQAVDVTAESAAPEPPVGDNPPRSDTPNTVVLNGDSQTLPVSFAADVIGTGAAETVQVPNGAAVDFAGGDGDRVELAQPLSAYAVETSGNTLTLSTAETRATVALNGDVTLAFADGGATAGIGFTESGPAVTLGGATVGPSFNPATVQLDPDRAAALAGNENAAIPPAAGNGNVLVLNGESQTLAVPFAAEVRGTGADETLQVPAATDVRVAGDDGDEIEFAFDLASYSFTQSGNVLAVEGPRGGRGEIALNGPVELGFADGSATAELVLGNGIGAAVGGETVGDGFDSGAVELDAGDVSALARVSGDDGIVVA